MTIFYLSQEIFVVLCNFKKAWFELLKKLAKRVYVLKKISKDNNISCDMPEIKLFLFFVKTEFEIKNVDLIILK